MEKLYSETPLQRQRSRASSSGISDWLDYGQIATAGAPRNLTGEGIIALGALFSQMDFGLGKEDEPQKIDDEPSIKEKADKIFGKDPFGGNKALNKYLAPKDPFGVLLQPNPRPDLVNGDGQGTQGKEEDKPDSKNNIIDLDAIKTEARNRVIRDTTGRGTSSQANMALDINNRKFNQYTEQLDSLQKRNVDPNYVQNVLDMINMEQVFGVSPGKRLKPELLSLLEDLRYKNKGKDDTPLHRVMHAEQSPFLQTKGVDYRQMRRATAPSYTGEIGKAAMEGFNLVIDKYNYDQAVQADYEEELDDQMGSLNVEADFATDQARKDYLEVALAKKQKLAKGFNDYANGRMSKLEYENLKSTLQSEINMIAGTTSALTNLRKDYQENRGKFNIKASDPEIADFLITLDKNPEAISFKTIDGIDYIKGKTRQGKDFQVPTSKIANGLAGFRLVENVSTTPMVASALKEMNAYKETVKTDFGYGTAMASPEKAKEIGLGAIKSYLANDENALRSTLANKFGAGYTAYENLLGEDKAANRTAMLNDAAEYIYTTEVEERYFPRTITTKFQQDAKTSSTAGERQRMQLSKAIGNLPAPTGENFNQYKSFIDTQYDYKIKDGKLLIGLKGKKKDEISLADPNFKSRFSKFAKLPAFIENPQDLSQYNFEL